MELSTCVTVFIMVLCQQMKTYYSQPLKKKEPFPNSTLGMYAYERGIRLYSAQRAYVAIKSNGDVYLEHNPEKEDTMLEMHSYSVTMKRIKRRGSDLWLSIDRKGNIKTKDGKNKKGTLFRENQIGGWLWYENRFGYVLAFRKNTQPKHNIKNERIERVIKDKAKTKKVNFIKFLIRQD